MEQYSDDEWDGGYDELSLSAPAAPIPPPWWPTLEPIDKILQHAALGTACALSDLMRHWFDPSPEPPYVLLDEGHLPLCTRGAPISSFDWGSPTTLLNDLDVPPLSAVCN